MAVTHICFVGASTTEGVGDESHRGWPGRLVAMAPAAGRLHSVYNLGVHGQTTAQIARRWHGECAARLPSDGRGAVVFFFGLNDIAQVDDGPLRRPLHRTLSAVEAIISEAAVHWPVLWIGPAPVAEDCMPVRGEGGHSFDFRNARIARLNEGYGEIAARLGVHYLDIFGELLEVEDWLTALRVNDGLHPSGEGYQLLAVRIAAWDAWAGLFGR